MGPGLPCDCAVNTAVLSQREPARHRETLSSLLLLIEKPIAIYVLTLDTECSPRGTAPARALLGSPHTCALLAWSCRCGGAEAAPKAPQGLAAAPAAPMGRAGGHQLCGELLSRGMSFIQVFSEEAETWVPRVPGTCGLQQLDSFCPVCLFSWDKHS